MSALTTNLIDASGFVNPRVIADEFHTTIKEVAAFSGLSPDTVSKKERFSTKTSQKRLREVAFIINRIMPWCGSSMQAYAWYRSEPLPSFGGLTAEDLVKRDMAEEVLAEISRFVDGGFA